MVAERKNLVFDFQGRENILHYLCDISMQKVSGTELKRMIAGDEQLRLTCMPFLFLSTSGASASVMKACSYNVQGSRRKDSALRQRR